jgi:hypothetical protein
VRERQREWTGSGAEREEGEWTGSGAEREEGERRCTAGRKSVKRGVCEVRRNRGEERDGI